MPFIALLLDLYLALRTLAFFVKFVTALIKTLEMRVDSIYNKVPNKISIFSIVILLIGLFFAGCERDRRGDPIELFVKNFSADTVLFVTQFNYPDTSLQVTSSEVRGAVANPNSESKFWQFAGWEREIKIRNPDETLIVIVYSLDTFQKYPFEQIQNDYNILRRYDLTIEQLRSLDWTVTYP